MHLGQEAFLDLQAAWQRESFLAETQRPWLAVKNLAGHQGDEWVAACDKLRDLAGAAWDV